jgi:hypothetical protein
MPIGLSSHSTSPTGMSLPPDDEHPRSPRHPFTPEEDVHLIHIMESQQFSGWLSVANQIPGRTSRQCRERWFNYLSPSILVGPWTEQEDLRLIAEINRIGRCWSTLAASFGGRSENDIKNRWYSHLRYQCTGNPGRLRLSPDGQSPDFPNRKKRMRVTPNPKEQARALIELEQQIPAHHFVLDFRVLLARPP